MSQKKNTKSKLKKTLSSVLIIFFCLTGSAVSLFLFFYDLNRVMTKDEPPIATITFKHKSAQRKFLEREIWDRLKQKSSLYNGDTIRTAELSEAVIHMIENQGDFIELFENSIVQIFLKDGELVIDISSGGVTVKTSSTSKGLKVRIGNTSVKLEGGSSLSAVSDGKTSVSNIHLVDGHAFFVNDDGTIEELSGGQSAIFEKDENGIPRKIESIPVISVSSPSANEKVLCLDSSDIAVDFKWTVENLEGEDYLVLDLSFDRDFNKFSSYSLENLNEVTKYIPNKNCYWRIYSKKTGPKYAAKSKINVVDAEAVSLVVPVDNYEALHRGKKSRVKFLWTDQDWISSYCLKISRKKDFSESDYTYTVSITPFVVSDIPDGKWYWKVVPYYASDITAEEIESETRSFTVKEKADMEKVRLLYPPSGGEIETFARENLSFSWKNVPEAKNYSLSISSDPDFKNCEVIRDCKKNTCVIDKSVLQKFVENQETLYWKVSYMNIDDIEGPDSSVRSFTLAPKMFIQKLTFPPDGYKIEVSRLKDVTFMWKTNLAGKGDTFVEFSSDADFKTKLDYSLKGDTSCVLEEKLSEGTYWWRICTKSQEKLEYSKARTFCVQNSLKAPEVRMASYVQDEKVRIGLKKGEKAHFAWESIDEADSYRFKLYHAENTSKAVYENNFVTENNIDLDLQDFRNGDYVWTVQANAGQSDLSTRFTGEVSENNVEVRKLGSIILKSPFDGSSVNESIFDKKTGHLDFKWKTEENNSQLTFTLNRITSSGRNEIVKTFENPDERISVYMLEPGRYSWSVSGKTYDGYDIESSVKTFSVKKRKPLAKPYLLLPKHNKTYSPEDLSGLTAINFKWRPVKNASSYVITIRRGKKLVLRKNVGRVTKFSLTDKSLLSDGTFTWSVEAYEIVSKGRKTIKSKPSTASFNIDLPSLDSIELDDAGILYGL